MVGARRVDALGVTDSGSIAGAAIARLRRGVKITQGEIAGLIGTDQANIARLETPGWAWGMQCVNAGVIFHRRAGEILHQS
jgi:hypothetical protein